MTERLVSAFATITCTGLLVAQFLVVHDGGRVFALDNRCPHMDFPLERGSIEELSLASKAAVPLLFERTTQPNALKAK